MCVRSRANDLSCAVSRTSKSREVAPTLEQVASVSLEQVMSVSSVCPRGRNEPKLTCMNQEKGRSLGQFAQQTC
jgi:hypothetical protein